MAQSVLPSADAAGTEDGESGDGAPTGDSFVLDVARKTGVRATEKFGSHAGQPGTGDGVYQNTEYAGLDRPSLTAANPTFDDLFTEMLRLFAAEYP